MKYRITVISFTAVLALLSSCCSGHEQPELSDMPFSSETQASSVSLSSTVPLRADTGKNTLFIYMCGSDLETRQGLGGKSIDELLSANIGEKLNIVIQTGGAKKWRSHDIRSDKLQRWEIKDGQLELIETLDDRSMGDGDTLASFLAWGSQYYNSPRKSLVLWNHGAGCVGGVCSDENHVGDTLRLDEITSALSDAEIHDKYEIIGFDACLMASVETAAAVKNYAQYMAASEENEPGGGWDYKAFVESLAHDEAVETGKIICESFMKKSEATGKGKAATMSFFDLSKTDELLSEFERFTETLSEALKRGNKQILLDIAVQSEQFGSKSSYLNSSNLVDLGDFVGHADFCTDTRLPEQIDRFVVCSVSNGRNNKGVSFYFPIDNDRTEIEKYSQLDFSTGYFRFLKALYS